MHLWGDGLRRAATTYWPALIGAAVALFVAARPLGRPDALTGVHSYDGTGYDDGVYLGSAVRLLQGSLPWSDFDFLHPPGITWLMVPAAAFGELTSTQDGLALARLITVLVAGGSALLAGVAVRSRGRLAMLASALILASFPLAVAATHSVMLEPYLVFFCLLALVLTFRSDGSVADGRRLLVAGLALGFACSVKIWGALVVVALLAALVPHGRKMVRWSVGVTLGFVVPTVPFFVLAPKTFLHDVVAAQLTRGTAGKLEFDFAERLPIMLGLELLPTDEGMARAKILGLVLAALVATAVLVVLTLRTATRLDVAAVLALGATFAGLASPPQFYDHYAYVLAAFGAVVLGLALSAVVDAARRALTRVTSSERARVRAVPAVLAGAAVVVASAWALPGNLDRADDYVAFANDPSPAVRSAVPAASCVVTDMPIILLASGRFPTTRSCDFPLDPFGLWLTDNAGDPAGSPPPFEAAFVERWRGWMAQADFVVLSVPFSNYLPWTQDLMTWFQINYVLLAEAESTFVYARVSTG